MHTNRLIAPDGREGVQRLTVAGTGKEIDAEVIDTRTGGETMQ